MQPAEPSDIAVRTREAPGKSSTHRIRHVRDNRNSRRRALQQLRCRRAIRIKDIHFPTHEVSSDARTARKVAPEAVPFKCQVSSFDMPQPGELLATGFGCLPKRLARVMWHKERDPLHTIWRPGPRSANGKRARDKRPEDSAAGIVAHRHGRSAFSGIFEQSLSCPLQCTRVTFKAAAAA